MGVSTIPPVENDVELPRYDLGDLLFDMFYKSLCVILESVNTYMRYVEMTANNSVLRETERAET